VGGGKVYIDDVEVGVVEASPGIAVGFIILLLLILFMFMWTVWRER